MKKILYTTCLLFILSLSSSCNKWLDLEPRDGITRQEFWKTKEDILAAVSGCYTSLLAAPPTAGDRSLLEYMFMFGELRADMISAGPSITPAEVDIMNVNITSDNGIASWASFYRTINYCNTVLDNAPNVKSTDPTLTDAILNGYLSEALTLRSMMYFYLVRTFSDVPLKLKATVKDTDLENLAKTKQADILKQIVADLKKAESFSVTTYGNTKSDKGRVTKFTINALLADVYLWMEDYPASIAECNKIIESQRYALVGSNSAWYNTVFFRGSSTETIFEFDQAIENPFFNLLVNTRRRYIASPFVASEIYIPDETDPDNVYDIRPGSFYNNAFTIQKYGTENPSYVKWQAYRLSDIMMIKAEALALTGGGAEALELVRTLRTRRNAVKATEQNVDPGDSDAICDYILAERAREFAFEGKRWFDLLRHAKRNNYSRIDILLDVVSKTVMPTLQQSAITKFRDYNSHYLPIPQVDINTNPSLIQNPFYTK
ncbi:RagB/SusD family nutrient uptake outer membrane protein [Pedobacter frigidisoli]|uniref:RagB/SusD family nutrient uptake outer membrane protein n=1 Tax=Pedobacter frigidisoli TaxID=2530455 RepID=UPI00292EC4C8|nr:RagB/SusD family nutrient uptake outer membrane protein [Pedobacter frigidisoli]